MSNSTLKENYLLVIFSVAMLVLPLLSINCKINDWAMTSIILIDLYLVLVLGFSAHRSDKLSKDVNYQPPSFIKYFFPSRLVGVIVFFLILCSLILDFGILYLNAGTIINFSTAINSLTDALYFSVVTMTTLGYGDITPISSHAKLLVIFQVSSGLLLLFGVFPLLIARLSGFTR